MTYQTLSALIRILWPFALAVATFVGGCTYKGNQDEKSALAKQGATAVEVVKDAQQGVIAATQKSADVESKIEASSAQVEEIRSSLHTKILTNSGGNVQTISPRSLALDPDTVRLLNTATGVSGLYPAASGDAKVQAPAAAASDAESSVEDLIQHDLTVMKLYRELAARHDALVDAVQDEMNKRAKR